MENNDQPAADTAAAPEKPSKISGLMPILGTLGAAFLMAAIRIAVAPKSGKPGAGFNKPYVP